MNGKKAQIELTVTLVLLLAMSMLASTIVVNAASTIPTSAYVAAIPNVIGAGQTLVISAWVTPPPDIGWNYAGYYFDITNPDGTNTTKGPYNSFPDGTTYFTLNPTVVGTYSVVLRWAGGDSTVNYAGKPTPPRVPYRPAVSEAYKFVVQQEQVQIGPKEAPLPTGTWTRPISSDLRSWSGLAGGGDWLYPGGFGDSWRPDDLGNNQVNPYSTGPNSAHIVWLNQSAPGGMVGGLSGPIANPGFPMINVVISGVGYYQLNGLHAVDMRTGKDLWVNTAMTDSPSFGQPASIISVPNVGSSVVSPSLWVVTATAIKQYSAQTGALMNNYPVTNFTNYAGQNQSITNFANVIQPDLYNPDGGVLIYFTGQNSAGSRTGSILVCWNSSKAGTTFASKIQWTAPGIQVETRPFVYVYKDVVITSMQGQAGESNMTAYNATTGKLLWNTSFPYELEGNPAIAYGKLYSASGTDRKWHAIDVNTGKEVWQSPAADFPFGAFWAYSTAAAYNKIYGESYDGHLYAFDANTGNVVWKFYSGNTTETPFNTWPFYARMVVADGKIYAGTTEHSPTPPYTTGNRIYCLDANTGALIWSMAGQYQSKSIADGVLVAVDDYTGQLFAWGKGPTSTSLSISSTQLVKGQSVGISGTVLDQSPAQQGTPAVSKDSMTAQMEYLHMNRPAPTNTTGVPVKLYALLADGTKIDIGQATTNAMGHFSLQWTPPDAKAYTVVANFTGDDSYLSSYAIADINVAVATANSASAQPSSSSSPIVTPLPTGVNTPASSPSSSVVPPSGNIFPATYIAIAVAIIVIAVAIVALLLRRQR